jgi:hypothetical protein
VTRLYVTNDFQTSDGRDELADQVDPPGGVWSRLRDWALPVWQPVVEHSVLLTQIVYAWRTDDQTLEDKITRRFGSIDAYWERHPGWIRSRDALRGIAQDCRRRGVPLVVFTYALSEDFFTKSLYPRVARVGTEEGFPVIDVRTRAHLTEPVEDYENSAADLHPNAKGHAVIAEVMSEALRDRVATKTRVRRTTMASSSWLEPWPPRFPRIGAANAACRCARVLPTFSTSGCAARCPGSDKPRAPHASSETSPSASAIRPAGASRMRSRRGWRPTANTRCTTPGSATR